MRQNALPLPQTPTVAQRKLQSFSLSTHWLRQDDTRLDATFYARDVFTALRLIDNCPYPKRTLGDPSVSKTIFNLPRFKRVYSPDRAQGWPYLSAKEAFLFRPKSDRYLAKLHAPRDAQRHFVEKGWIVISCSGSVGRCILATKRLGQYFLTHDLLRLAPTLPSGYVYAFLSSSLAQPLLTRERYGATVTHLEFQHVAKIPIPIVPDSDQQAIHEKIEQAYALRDEANNLLDQAEHILHTELALPQLAADIAIQHATRACPVTFSLALSSLRGRFDASFHSPAAQRAVDELKKGKYTLCPLGTLCKRIYIAPRFKRIYVEAEHGIPFLQGSHVPMIKPFDLKFLSTRAHPDLEPWTIHSRWVLVTCSGTIGRTALASSHLDGWAASQHIARIITEPPTGHPGYIAVFLMSEYGQRQLTSKIYGGVVDELTEEDIAAIWLPQAPPEIQATIGELAVTAFEKKGQANTIEEDAIRELESLIARS